MKVLIFVSSVLAAATAGWAPSVYYGQHIPVIGPNGVPIETPEVQAAKAHHFAAHAEASARTGHYGGILAAAPLVHAYGVPGAVTHDGHPLDTPEVAAAKAQHYADYAVAAQRNGVHVPYAQIGAGLPIDTPEVQLAKVAHFAAHAAARNGIHYRKRRSLYPQHIPVIGPNGVPVETPEVQAAKANHLAALAQASVRSGAVVPVHYTAGYGAVPVISNGVPVDTPEVQAAKAHHFAAHAAARGGHVLGAYAGAWTHQPHAVIGHDGQPVETPEVQLAKAAHFAAHAASRNHYY